MMAMTRTKSGFKKAIYGDQLDHKIILRVSFLRDVHKILIHAVWHKQIERVDQLTW